MRLGQLGWDIAGGVFAVALVYMLVRPSSGGPGLVTASTGALADIVQFAVGG